MTKIADTNVLPFSTQFSVDREDILRLLDYQRWLVEGNIHEKIRNCPFPPSSLWNKWARATFIGFSGDAVLSVSGHCFTTTLQFPQKTLWRKIQRRRLWNMPYRKKFTKLYPPAPFDTVLEQQDHITFWRIMEAVAQSGVTSVDNLLEIGAGAGLHVAYRNPKTATIIDLPETVPVGFLFLSQFYDDIALPNENHEAKLKFLLPHQKLEGEFDFCFSSLSFQEMDLPVVKKYLELFRQHVTNDGKIQLIQAKKGRCCADVPLYADHWEETPFLNWMTGVEHCNILL